MDSEIKEIYKIVADRIKNDYPEEIKRRIESSVSASSLDITTSFGKPHLDVNIHLEGGREFVASYSNNNYSEHSYKRGTQIQVVAEDILRLLDSLMRSGAIQIDVMTRDGAILLSTTTKIGKSENTTDVKKVTFLKRKRKITKQYPPVL